MSLAMGFQDCPQCLSCLARGLGRRPRELRDHLVAYIAHHECLQAGWEQAGAAEGAPAPSRPPCLWAPAESTIAPPSSGEARPAGPGRPLPPPRAEWDAGEMGCGDLVMQLRMHLHALPPGEILKLTARDPGAPEDLPAWCRLTGHRLLSSAHPEYWIQRKEG
jgi:tRNA 2-thiouridine synthesizing protein A